MLLSVLSFSAWAQVVRPLDPGLETGESQVRVSTSAFTPALVQQGFYSTLATEVVDENNTDWGFLEETPTGTGSFVVGPGTPPAGAGSAELTVDASGGYLIGTQLHAGTRFDAITSLAYSTYRTSGSAELAIALQFNVDYDLTDGDVAVWQGRLVYEPYQSGSNPTTGVWETWNPLAGEWWSSGAPGNATCPQSTPCTWAEVLTAFPDAGIQATTLAGVLFKAGSGWTSGFEGNVDNFTIGVSGSETTYDFEPVLPVHNITQGTDHPTLQDGIDNAIADDVLEIDAGTLAEGPQITIDKDLTIRGAGTSSAAFKTAAVTTLVPTASTGTSGDSRAWILVDTGVALVLEDLILDGTGFDIHQAIRHKGSGTVTNVIFQNLVYPPPVYAGTAIAAFGDGAVDVSGCTFTNVGRVGVLYFGSGVSGSVFSGNTYTGKGDGDFLDYALDISNGAVITVEDNVISENRGIASSDGSTSAGILVSTFFGPGTTATIEGNVISNSSTGIFVGFDAPDASDVTALSNDLAGNGIAVRSTNPLVDASGNWYGVTAPGDVAAEISGNVDYSPWLDSNTDAEPGTAGFQGDFSTLTVDDDSPVAGTEGHLQEGVDLVTASTVKMADGTYTESVSIAKALTLAPLSTGAVVQSLDVSDDVTLMDNDLEITTNLNVQTGGQFITDGSTTLVLGSSATISETDDGGQVWGTVRTTRTVNMAVTETFGGMGFTITAADASPGDVELTRVTGDPQTIDITPSVERYFDATPTNNGGLNATIVFEYTTPELNGLDESDFSLFSSEDNGTSWSIAGGTPTPATNSVTVTGIDMLSRWTASESSALPIVLTSFDAVVLDQEEAELQWTTASELNNAGFEIQHQYLTDEGSETWETLGFIEGAGTVTEARSYSYRTGALTIGTHTFRLKQIDFDGGVSFSPVVEVTIELAEAYVLYPAYPNPFNPQTTLRFAVAEAQPVRVVLYNLFGQHIRELYAGEVKAGQVQDVRLDGRDLASGTYLLRVLGETFTDTQQITLVK